MYDCYVSARFLFLCLIVTLGALSCSVFDCYVSALFCSVFDCYVSARLFFLYLIVTLVRAVLFCV